MSPDAETVVVPARFNGPLESGNGGYCAGRFAALLEGPAAVSLRAPVPLERPLRVDRGGGAVRLSDGEKPIAEVEAEPDLAIELPEPVGVGEARAARERYGGDAEGPFSRCFVCGLARDDGFGLFAGPVAGRDVVAAPWTPPAWAADAEGRVRPEFVWAALDCPTYFAAHRGEEGTIAFLVRMRARLEAPVTAGEEHVAIGWPISSEGRKRLAGSAILRPDGTVLAAADVLLVEPRPQS